MIPMTAVSIPGATLQVADVGNGPVSLFAHGFPLDHSMWDGLSGELSRDFRCIAPDLRGLGRSSVTDGTVTMEQFADDLAALLDALQIVEPVIFCGLSMGGCIAWQFARRHAQRLKALILCDCRAAPDSPAAATNRHELAENVVRQGPSIVADMMLPRLFAPESFSSRPQLIAQTRRVIESANPRGIAAAARGLASRPDATPWLASIDSSSLLVVGEHDVISPPGEMRGIAARMPHATLAVIPKAGHMAPLENVLDTSAQIRTFLASIA